MTRHGSLSLANSIGTAAFWLALFARPLAGAELDRTLSLTWDKEILSIHGEHLPGGVSTSGISRRFVAPVQLDATGSRRSSRTKRGLSRRAKTAGGSYCNPVWKTASWLSTRLLPAGMKSISVSLRPTRRAPNQVLIGHNPVFAWIGTRAPRRSVPPRDVCLRCFVDVDGKFERLPTTPWARAALNTPGQVWCPRGVSRDDVNPRPLSSIVPSSGLIGCVSADGRELMATAWEPYQELFQGVIVCLHSDFRIGGLEPGQSKTIRGKIYLMSADFAALRARYRRDFPGQEQRISRTDASSSDKKLIEFGWDEPDTGFLRRHRNQLEQTPFDGCVFHVLAGATAAPANFTWLCWGRRRFSESELEPATRRV